MKQLKQRFFSTLMSPSSTNSLMRYMCLIALIVACFIGVTGLFLNKELLGLAALCGSFLVPAFGGKAFQKFAEVQECDNGNPRE